MEVVVGRQKGQNQEGLVAIREMQEHIPCAM